MFERFTVTVVDDDASPKERARAAHERGVRLRESGALELAGLQREVVHALRSIDSAVDALVRIAEHTTGERGDDP